jgi:hypothetical protein
MSIAVALEYQGRGIGKVLVGRFCDAGSGWRNRIAQEKAAWCRLLPPRCRTGAAASGLTMKSPPSKGMVVPFYRPGITQDEINEVVDCLNSGWLTTHREKLTC